VVRLVSSLQEIERDHAELQRRATLQEQHLVGRRDAHELAQVGFCLLSNGNESLRTVGHLERGETGPVDVEKLLARALHHLARQRGRTGAEVVDLAHGSSLNEKRTGVTVFFRNRYMHSFNIRVASARSVP